MWGYEHTGDPMVDHINANPWTAHLTPPQPEDDKRPGWKWQSDYRQALANQQAIWQKEAIEAQRAKEKERRELEAGWAKAKREKQAKKRKAEAKAKRQAKAVRSFFSL